MKYLSFGLLCASLFTSTVSAETIALTPAHSSIESAIILLQNEMRLSSQQLKENPGEYSPEEICNVLEEFDRAFEILESLKGKELQHFETYSTMLDVAHFLMALDIVYSLQPTLITLEQVKNEITAQLSALINNDGYILWGGQILYLSNYETLLISPDLIEILSYIRSMYVANNEDTKELNAIIEKLKEINVTE
jgi:hypothetical protein